MVCDLCLALGRLLLSSSGFASLVLGFLRSSLACGLVVPSLDSSLILGDVIEVRSSPCHLDHVFWDVVAILVPQGGHVLLEPSLSNSAEFFGPELFGEWRVCQGAGPLNLTTAVHPFPQSRCHGSKA